jgi:PRC-barrel domain
MFACIALLLLGAAPEPPTSEVQKVPPEQALAVLGHTVADPEGKDIGRLIDVLVDRDGQPQAAVIDFGGFLGVGSRKIAVHWNTVHFAPSDPKHQVTLDLTPDQIKAAPEFKDTAKPAAVVVAQPPQAVGPSTEATPSPPPPGSAGTATAPPQSPAASPDAEPPPPSK